MKELKQLYNAIQYSPSGKLFVDYDKEVDVLFPIGGGTYVDAQAKKTSTVLFDVGAGIVIEKPSEDAIKKIQERIEDLQRTQERIASMIQQIQSEASELSEKAQRLVNEAKK